jgi:predicted deacetylase
VSPERLLVVSVHDVGSVEAEGVAWLLERLDALGARPRVLKVVPNEAGAGLDSAPGLLRLLRAEAAHGSETVLHGFTHRLAGDLGGPRWRRLHARLLVGPSAEFLSVDRGEAAARLEAGRRQLEEAGLQARGFCAPGWASPGWLPGLLAELGFDYQVRMASVLDLRSGSRMVTPWAGFMGAPAAHEALVALGSGAGLAAAAAAPVLKVFLHPQGARRSPACRRILDLVGRQLERRRPVTYGALLAS